MCGIVGVVSSRILSDAERRMFAWLLYLDKVRGVDSTGVIFGSSTHTVRATKGIGSPEELWLAPENEKIFESNGTLKMKEASFAVGHNRAATAGSITARNAHPFRHGKVIGVHNGTIHWGLSGLKVPHHEVDSSMVINAIANGMSIQEVEEKITGAYALVWHDAEDGTLHFARNNQRPLHYVFNTSKGTMAFASEAWMITVAAKAAKCNIFNAKDIKELATYTHMTVGLNASGPKIEIPVTEETYKASYNNTNNDWDGWDMVGGYRNHHGHSRGHVPNAGRTPAERTADRMRQESRIAVSEMGVGLVGWQDVSADTMDEGQFKKLTGCACSMCNHKITYEEFKQGNIKFLMNDSPVCHDCIVEAELEDDETKLQEQKVA